MIGRFPWGSDLGLLTPEEVAVADAVEATVEPNDLDTAEAEDDAAVGRRGSVYLVPGCPGLAGSSRMVDFLDSIKTTRLMLGLVLGSD